MLFITIWAIIFAVAGWTFAFVFMYNNREVLKLTKDVIEGWDHTIEVYGKLVEDHQKLLTKIKSWGNDTSESESVSQKAEEAISTAPVEGAI